MPSSVKILPLTATATKNTLDCVICSLSLEDPAVPPNRPNIKYVVKRHTSMQDFTQKIIDDLMSKRVNMPKTIVFCWSLQNCATFLR